MKVEGKEMKNERETALESSRKGGDVKKTGGRKGRDAHNRVRSPLAPSKLSLASHASLVFNHYEQYLSSSLPPGAVSLQAT